MLNSLKFKIIIIFSLIILYPITANSQFFNLPPDGECTIGVFSGSVTSDNRPILWKNRDVWDADQRYIHYSSYIRDSITTLPFTGNVYRADTTRVYMGANSAGFAIMNSDSYNLDDSLAVGIDDGTLMRIALETCQTIDDFILLLDSTNVIGRKDCWNFGVLDSSGNCAIYECSNYSYTEFMVGGDDPGNPDYLIRGNFSVSGNDNPLTGLDRYDRAISLTELKLTENYIDAGFVLETLTRDLYNFIDDPYPLPYSGSQDGGPEGYVFNLWCTIANRNTYSAVVIRGVADEEPQYLTTIFAMLGSPNLTLAFPLWVAAGNVPVYLNHPDGAPVYQYCWERRGRLYDNPDFIFHMNSRALCDLDSGGVYSYTIPLERWAVNYADNLVDYWLANPPQNYDVSNNQFIIARALFTGFQSETADIISGVDYDSELLPFSPTLYNYPNPFNSNTMIAFDVIPGENINNLRIFDTLGRLVREFTGTNINSNVVFWDGYDNNGKPVSAGIYFYLLNTENYTISNKMTLLK